MEQPVRRSVRLDPVDEKISFLAEKGVFVMGGGIDINVFFGFFMGILSTLYSENKKPIWIILDSHGGDIFQGLALYDFFKAISKQGVEVNIVGIGMVASVAACIMQAGTRRYAFPNTQFTIHQASLSGEGDPQEVNQLMENAKELERLNGIVMNIVAERSGMDMKMLMDLTKKTDYSISADKAKEFGQHGLIDEVITTFPFQINGYREL